MKKSFSGILFFLILNSIVYLSGCSSSKEDDDENVSEEKEEITENQEKSGEESTADIVWKKINESAREEQQNEMYSREIDSTLLYWLNDQLLILENSSKCNIYALNVLYRSGCKCPDENALSYDLMDTINYNDIFPVVFNSEQYTSPDNESVLESVIKKGDLIIWNGHVIIFESIVYLNGRLYANAWWAGTKQINNGVNIINDVVHGKYPLEGEFIVRRPELNHEN